MIKSVFSLLMTTAISLLFSVNVLAQQKKDIQPTVKAIESQKVVGNNNVNSSRKIVPLYQQTKQLKAADKQQRTASNNLTSPQLKAHTQPSAYADIDQKIISLEQKIVALKADKNTHEATLEKYEATLERVKQIRSIRRNGF